MCDNIIKIDCNTVTIPQKIFRYECVDSEEIDECIKEFNKNFKINKAYQNICFSASIKYESFSSYQISLNISNDYESSVVFLMQISKICNMCGIFTKDLKYFNFSDLVLNVLCSAFYDDVQNTGCLHSNAYKIDAINSVIDTIPSNFMENMLKNLPMLSKEQLNTLLRQFLYVNAYAVNKFLLCNKN